MLDDEKFNVTWRCKNPECLVLNVDNYALTCVPICGECNQDYQWTDLLSKEKFDELNDLLAKEML